MDIQFQSINPENEDDLKRMLVPLLFKKVFHATDKSGFDGIIASGELLSGDKVGLEAQKWARANSYFRNREHISFCDFYHPTRCSKIRDGYRKYSFWRQKGEGAYLFILKDCHYSKLLTWDNLDKHKKYSEMVVPHIESGLKSPVPLAWFETVIRIELWKDSPLWEQISNEDAATLLQSIKQRKNV
jgi:hypothetical protein